MNYMNWGREVSIKHFNELYVKLGSRFDYEFWESEIAEQGRQIVLGGLDRGIFKKAKERLFLRANYTDFITVFSLILKACQHMKPKN
jgi:arginyl-tRNA synthetase